MKLGAWSSHPSAAAAQCGGWMVSCWSRMSASRAATSALLTAAGMVYRCSSRSETACDVRSSPSRPAGSLCSSSSSPPVTRSTLTDPARRLNHAAIAAGFGAGPPSGNSAAVSMTTSFHAGFSRSCSKWAQRLLIRGNTLCLSVAECRYISQVAISGAAYLLKAAICGEKKC